MQKSLTINAPRDLVWKVTADVEQWPSLTESMTSVQLDSDSLEVGAKARVKQPKLPVTTWTVTDLVPQESFVWKASAPGVTTRASHVISDGPGDAVTLTLLLEQAGPVGNLIGRATATMARRYLELESNGIKQRSEELAAEA